MSEGRDVRVTSEMTSHMSDKKKMSGAKGKRRTFNAIEKQISDVVKRCSALLHQHIHGGCSGAVKHGVGLWRG